MSGMTRSFSQLASPRAFTASMWLAIMLTFALALSVAPQGFAATQQISGVVTDTLGRPLAEVKLELRNQHGRAIAHAITDQAGHFKIAAARPGVYSLAA